MRVIAKGIAILAPFTAQVVLRVIASMPGNEQPDRFTLELAKRVRAYMTHDPHSK